MVTVALDVHPEHTHRWIDAARPEDSAAAHPSLVDTHHVTGELFGFVNIPMAVWIDETGTIVRNAESASIERSPLRDMEVPDGIGDRMKTMLTEVKAIPDHAEAYRAAIVDWATHGADSRFVRTPDEVIARSMPRDTSTARATACFELGRHLHTTLGGLSGDAAAIGWWKEAHRLDPSNWTYKRQAWTLATTAPDAEENDLVQEAGEVYGTSWIDDVLAGGGGAAYTLEPDL
ncbi:hypothetical protein BH23ACT3_BH23ACT3_12130 [soil metagenome]